MTSLEEKREGGGGGGREGGGGVGGVWGGGGEGQGGSQKAYQILTMHSPNKLSNLTPVCVCVKRERRMNLHLRKRR